MSDINQYNEYNHYKKELLEAIIIATGKHMKGEITSIELSKAMVNSINTYTHKILTEDKNNEKQSLKKMW